MEEVFLKVCNLSLQASVLILFIVLLRFLLQSKTSKRWVCFLWLLVGVRLILPYSVESAFSLAPRSDLISVSEGQVDFKSGLQTVDQPLNRYFQNQNDRLQETGGDQSLDRNTNINVVYIWSYIWQIGIAVMLFYFIYSYAKMRILVKASIQIEKNILVCDKINIPFILGILKPQIYLPSHMDDMQMDNVIAHEKTHLKRVDYLWKPLGFMLLTVYWFNPLCWIAYVLLCKDIEIACDERVIKDMTVAQKKQYSNVLLEFSQLQKNTLMCPLSFGEVGVKQRIEAIIRYKKTKAWIVFVTVLIFIVVGGLFLTNPKEKEAEVIDVESIENIEATEASSIISDLESAEKIESTSEVTELTEEQIRKESGPYLSELVVRVGTENAYEWSNTVDFKTHYADILIKMAEDETGEFQIYGIMSERYGTYGLLLNDVIDGEENHNIAYGYWNYSGLAQDKPILVKTEEGTFIFTLSVMNDGNVYRKSYILDCGYDTGHMELRDLENEVNSNSVTRIPVGEDDLGDAPYEGEQEDYLEFTEPKYRVHPITGDIFNTETGEVIKTNPSETSNNSTAITKEYITELQTQISNAMSNGELPFVTVSAVMENPNRLHIVVTSKSEENIKKLEAFDTKGDALEIEYSPNHIIVKE